MNETDFLRQQLALERAHLREILQAVRRDSLGVHPAQALAQYIDWAGRRLLEQLQAQRAALQAAPAADAEADAHLHRLAGAAAAVTDAGKAEPLEARAARLLALLDAWSDPLERQAARTLRIAHWRQAARLSADTILEERQRYTQARAAAGLP
jgi:hypothetical protein